MKKLFATVMAIMLICLSFSACAENDRLIDDADLFTPQEEAELLSMIGKFRQDTGMDFVLFTSSAPHSESQQIIADELYDRGGYGMGDEKSGILYYIDMYERIPYLCTTGAMIDYMTDERIEAAHESVYPLLAGGDYTAAAFQMIYAVYDYWQSGIPEGQYRYDIITGQVLTDRHKVLTSSEVMVCALIALVAALLFIKTVQGRYTLKGSTYHYSFRENSKVEITASADDYLRTTTTRTRRVQNTPGGSGGHSGGSGVHRSSGGSFHGGGAGRKF